MKQPEKWKETINPFSISFNNFKLIEVLGYPHARNDVFYCKGTYQNKETFCFVKYASKEDSNMLKEIEMISCLDFNFLPEIIDFDKNGKFIVTKEIIGERLSYILQTTEDKSIDYMFEYGKTLAQIHLTSINCEKVKHRKFFDIPTLDYLKEYNIDFIFDFLNNNKPKQINECFCHGDFHYANILWNNKKLSAVLDWELSGIGNKEFDIAWAIINRPSQKFLKTDKEVKEFLRGYKSVNSYNIDYVKYYMVLIYSHFISANPNNTKYQKFVRKWLKRFYKQYIKTPQELLKFFEENMKYGFTYRGKIYTDLEPDFQKNMDRIYKIRLGQDFINSGYGVCWDFCELERLFFSKNNIEHECYFIESYINCEEGGPTHTFALYQQNCKWYWFEYSWFYHRGIWEYNSKEEALKDILLKFEKFYDSKLINITIYKTDKVTKRLDAFEFVEHCLKGQRI